jgi:UPF0271 protein
VPDERAVDLNADLGEGVTDDDGLLAVVTSANVACGYHAGDVATMRRVCTLAAERRVVVGAQVSYHDRPNFGRVRVDVPPALLAEQVADQVGTLAALAAEAGTQVAYLKPHGALYHRVAADAEQARAVLAGALVAGLRLPVLGFPGGVLLALAAEEGRAVFTEGFPDRGYGEDGLLLPRTHPGALVHDPVEIAARAVGLAERVDSVCVHGDSPSAVAAATAVRERLRARGYTLRAFS